MYGIAWWRQTNDTGVNATTAASAADAAASVFEDLVVGFVEFADQEENQTSSSVRSSDEIVVSMRVAVVVIVICMGFEPLN